MILKGDVVDESGAVVKFDLLMVPIALVLLTYLVTVANMVRLYIINKGCGLVITENGIENTVAVINIFAFVIALPVRLIPWEAIKYYDNEGNHLYVRVKTKEIKAGFLARLIISVLGYSFCHGFIKPDVKAEDIEKYKYRFSLQK